MIIENTTKLTKVKDKNYTELSINEIPTWGNI